MKALVLGCGSIGFRHLGHLEQLGVSQIEAVDTDQAARARVRERKIPVSSDPKEALSRRPDVVLVCTPVASHVRLAVEALQSGAHVFIEKPLCIRPEEAQPLQEAAAQDGRVVQVGYNLRYHPTVRGAKKLVESGRIGPILTAHFKFGLYLKKWWKDRDYRTSYMAKSDLGGGLLLDSSHEIDLALFFLGKASLVSAIAGKLSQLEIQGVDSVKAIMKMQNGSHVMMSMDCLQPKYTRGFQLVGEGAAMGWDCSGGRADVSLGKLLVCDGKDETYSEVPVEGNPEDTYLEELKDFLAAVVNKRRSAVDLEQGLEVIKVAAALEESIRTGQTVRLNS